MAQHSSTIVWQRDDNASCVDHRYSRRHAWQFDGGAVVPASSSPHVVPLPFSDPAALHHRAHASCSIANSVKTELLCEPIVLPHAKAQP